MNGGEISGNTASFYFSGGGVFVNGGTFTMNGGEISGNTASSSSSGGGVSVYYGTFTMTGGEINDNTFSSDGGGVSVLYSGTFTMTGGAKTGNTSSSFGGRGVYITSIGSFVLKGNGMVALNNPVYLYDTAAAITIDDALDGTDPVAVIELSVDPNWLGKAVIKKSASFAGSLPADRFALTGPWKVDSDGKLQAKAASLRFDETRRAFINPREVQLYRFTPTPNTSYTITHYTREDEWGNYYSSVYASAIWEDGSEVLVNRSNNTTTPSFVADKPGMDIIIMVDSFTYYSNEEGYTGVYSVGYNEVD
jgi:hypothetical protein